jgi:hypothetical protein
MFREQIISESCKILLNAQDQKTEILEINNKQKVLNVSNANKEWFQFPNVQHIVGKALVLPSTLP